MVVAACGAGHHAATDAGSSDPLEIRGSCAFPLGAGGEVTFPATAVAVQTSYRPIDVVNASSATINGREDISWTVDGPDAAEFVVTTMLGSTDSESCGLHSMDTIPFLAGDTCRLDIEFRPTTAGSKQATLHAMHFGGIDQTFSMSATAVAAPAALFADTVDLYIKPVDPLHMQTFHIVNAGTTNVDLGDPVVTGPFELVPQPGWDCPSPLPPSGTCIVGSFEVASAAPSGCPSGMFTTTTSALAVPLTARDVP